MYIHTSNEALRFPLALDSLVSSCDSRVEAVVVSTSSKPTYNHTTATLYIKAAH